jgi:hypothetical protein
MMVTKPIVLEINLSDFFELKSLKCEEKYIDNLITDFKFPKLLMSGEISADVVGFCYHGGKIFF